MKKKSEAINVSTYIRASYNKRQQSKSKMAFGRNRASFDRYVLEKPAVSRGDFSRTVLSPIIAFA